LGFPSKSGINPEKNLFSFLFPLPPISTFPNYDIIDGMEGDKVDDPGSVYHGKRIKNGWKNSGSPWTFDVNPELTGLPNFKSNRLCDDVLQPP